MESRIFVNYRRDDAKDMAARIRDRLAQTFGDSGVFMDVDNLIAGQRFEKELEKALSQSVVFLSIIGPRWIELLNARRGERDYVREEIAGALQRGMVVIPVLIERTPLPRGDVLPGEIRELVMHQKHVVTYEQFGRDLAGLVEAIRFGRRAAPAVTSGGGANIRWVGAAALAVLVLGGGLLAYQVGAPGRGTEEKRREEINRAAEAAAVRKKADEEAQARLLRAEQDRATEATRKRSATVTALLERLEQRLRANGKNLSSWRILLWSYVKLGRKDDARAALAKARSNFNGDARALSELSQLAARLGLGSSRASSVVPP